MSTTWARVRLAGTGREIARARRARSLWERFRGLMLAPPPSPGEAVWLPDCDAIHTAFVGGPLDLLFLRDGWVLRVCPGVPPWRIVMCPGADAVLELAPGEVERLGLMAHQQVELTPDPAGRAA